MAVGSSSDPDTQEVPPLLHPRRVEGPLAPRRILLLTDKCCDRGSDKLLCAICSYERSRSCVLGFILTDKLDSFLFDAVNIATFPCLSACAVISNDDS